jgi:hypothetical protein
VTFAEQFDRLTTPRARYRPTSSDGRSASPNAE